MLKFLDLFFSEFEWYRKKSGGNWEQIQTPDESGWSSSYTYWKRIKEKP